MNPVVLASLSSAGGSMASSALQYANAEQNRSMTRSMDNTRYQRSMADMEKAGLNPILAAGGPQTGSGSGSPMGAVENPINSGLNAKKILAEIDNIDANTELTRNKKGMTDPMASIMGLVERFIDKPSKTSPGDINSAWDKAKNHIRKGKATHDKKVNSAKKWFNRGSDVDIEAKGFKE